MKHICLLTVCALGIALCIEHDSRGFDDTILFKINWPGDSDVLENLADNELNKSQPQNKEVLTVTTSQKEKYECHIPESQTKETNSIEDYEGPSPINLLKPLFAQKICSYRLESYWSYEICHGRYIRQYHDERDGKQVKTQQYYLGYWSPEKQIKLEEDLKLLQESKQKPKTIKMDGLSLPSVEMAMDDGSVCDLSGKPRMTRVLYVCYSHGKHEVYSFKETATCEYEIIILSPLLCEHPQFKVKEVSENPIDCFPVAGAPKKPQGLLQMEVDSLKFQHQTIKYMNSDKDAKDLFAVLKVEQIDKDGEPHLKFELHPLNEEDELPDESPQVKASEKPIPPLLDDTPVRAFLNGEECMNGGTGWWKYEFCYGKHLIQYHVGRGGEKITLLLGKFDEEAHLEWIQENKRKAPKPVEQRTSISHFYSGGDICDKTGKPRETEVKLKCYENSSNPAQVTLYLLEPRTCNYILGVESRLICDILPLADENGLIKSPIQLLRKQDTLVESELDDEESEAKEKYLPKIGND